MRGLVLLLLIGLHATTAYAEVTCSINLTPDFLPPTAKSSASHGDFIREFQRELKEIFQTLRVPDDYFKDALIIRGKTKPHTLDIQIVVTRHRDLYWFHPSPPQAISLYYSSFGPEQRWGKLIGPRSHLPQGDVFTLEEQLVRFTAMFGSVIEMENGRTLEIAIERDHHHRKTWGELLSLRLIDYPTF